MKAGEGQRKRKMSAQLSKIISEVTSPGSAHSHFNSISLNNTAQPPEGGYSLARYQECSAARSYRNSQVLVRKDHRDRREQGLAPGVALSRWGHLGSCVDAAAKNLGLPPLSQQ